MKVIGLMSGTSGDGIDAALCEINGAPPRLEARILNAITMPYDANMRQRILDQCAPETSRVDLLCQLHFDLAHAFAESVLRVVEEAGVELSEIDLIGSHGQTVWHQVRPDGQVSATLQIAEGGVIAERTGVTTLANFRARDVAAGGQGAPLTGYVDWLLLRHETGWRAIQNIGGMGNVTFLPPLDDTKSAMVAFDTGPGNALIDVAVSLLSDGQQTYDADGEMAAGGMIDLGWLEILLDHPFFRRLPPKTTGREVFGTAMAQKMVMEGRGRGLRDADIVATLTALTAQSIAYAYEQFAPQAVSEIILGGGGRHNQTLVKILADLLAPATIRTHEDVGIGGDFKEALVFAVLAYESWHNRPGTMPAQTGAQHATVLGQITPGGNYAMLLNKTWQLG